MNLEVLHILLFDAECILCNKSVQYIIKHDTKKQFRFASLQSEIGQQLLTENQLGTKDLSTVVYINKSIVYTKSTAAIRVFAQLGILHKFAILFLIVPTFMRDFCYNLVAANRHRLFKDGTCLIPSKELNERILK
jgi:predicted DCC family thiol-disulfide oxidoreductase YuxK